MDLEKLFKEEQVVSESVRTIGSLILELSDFTSVDSPEELAKSQILGKKICSECAVIDKEVHKARVFVHGLMKEKVSVKFKSRKQELSEIENELALIHGDVHAIGEIARDFFNAKDRMAAFNNLSRIYSELMQHLLLLVVESEGLKA